MAGRAGVPTLQGVAPPCCCWGMLCVRGARSCVSVEHGAACPWNMETGCCGRCEPRGPLLGEEGAPPLGQVAQLGD